jgi:hypothetical protein
MKRYHYEKRAKKWDQMEQAVSLTAAGAPTRNGVVVRWDDEKPPRGQQNKSKQNHKSKKVARSKHSVQRQPDSSTTCHSVPKLDKQSQRTQRAAARESRNGGFALEEADDAARRSMELANKVQNDTRSLMPNNEFEKSGMRLSDVVDDCRLLTSVALQRLNY